MELASGYVTWLQVPQDLEPSAAAFPGPKQRAGLELEQPWIVSVPVVVLGATGEGLACYTVQVFKKRS